MPSDRDTPPPRRARAETLSSLGRAPARRMASIPPPLPPGHDDDDDGVVARGAVRRWIHGALFDNIGLKFLSIVLAITVFLLVNTDRDREISARVGVSYTLPDDKVLISEKLDEVRISIKGPWRRLRKFDERELERITLDLRRAPSGEFPITPDLVHLPSGLTLESITPRAIRVAWDRRIDKVVEIAPQVAGTPQHGYVVSEVKAAPATVKVRGPEVTVGALASVATQKISVDGRTEAFNAETDAVAPDNCEIVGTPQVLVHVAIEEELVTRKLPGLQVTVRGEGVDPARWALEPAQIEVSLTGSLLAVEKAKATLAPVVKLGPGDGRTREVEVIVEGVPPGIGVKVSPERVRVSPVKPAAPAQPPTQ